MAKVTATAHWTDESGVTRKYEYSGKGTPTHAVIDTSNDGAFVGWTKDPAGYIRKREADHGVLEALPLVWPTDESEEAEITATMGGYSDNEGAQASEPGTVDKSIRDPHSPILNPESSGWSLFLARLTTDQILGKMTELSRQIVETPDQADRLRADLTRYQEEWDRRGARGEIVVPSDAPSAPTSDAPVQAGGVVFTPQVPDGYRLSLHTGDPGPQGQDNVVPIVDSGGRPVVDTPALDGGNASTALSEDYVTSTVAEARAAVSTASSALSRMVSLAPDRASVVRAATIRAEVHRALYLIGQVAMFTDVNDRAAVAELANLAAQDAVTAASV